MFQRSPPNRRTGRLQAMASRAGYASAIAGCTQESRAWYTHDVLDLLPPRYISPLAEISHLQLHRSSLPFSLNPGASLATGYPSAWLRCRRPLAGFGRRSASKRGGSAPRRSPRTRLGSANGVTKQRDEAGASCGGTKQAGALCGGSEPRSGGPAMMPLGRVRQWDGASIASFSLRHLARERLRESARVHIPRSNAAQLLQVHGHPIASL